MINLKTPDRRGPLDLAEMCCYADHTYWRREFRWCLVLTLTEGCHRRWSRIKLLMAEALVMRFNAANLADGNLHDYWCGWLAEAMDDDCGILPQVEVMTEEQILNSDLADEYLKAVAREEKMYWLAELLEGDDDDQYG